jgi:hypothetical protein
MSWVYVGRQVQFPTALFGYGYVKVCSTQRNNHVVTDLPNHW